MSPQNTPALESITLRLSYDPALLPYGVDPSTSEGKAEIREVILKGLQGLQAEGQEFYAIAYALLAE